MADADGADGASHRHGSDEWIDVAIAALTIPARTRRDHQPHATRQGRTVLRPNKSEPLPHAPKGSLDLEWEVASRVQLSPNTANV